MLIICIEKGDYMSEIALFPIDNVKNTTFTVKPDKSIVGNGDIYAPFTMINITDTPFLSDKKNQGWQIFASNQPLTGGLYWLMYIKTPITLRNKYFQSGNIYMNGDFEIYFRTCKKPLLLANVRKLNELPYQTPMQVLRIGKIPETKIISQFNNKAIDYTVIDRPLTLDECEKILIYRSFIQRGVNLNVLYPTRKA